MFYLILGLLLWVGAHFFKRFAPGPRARLGDAGKGLVAVLSLAGIVLMVIGYRAADPVFLWDLGSWTRHLNNLLMLVAVALFGLGNSKSRLRGSLRHPMLTGVILWAGAHLMVNGDLPSLVLFGGMALWAIGEMVVINRAEPAPARFASGTVQGDVRLAVITLAVYAVIGGLHIWLGPNPFGA
jgi:uncharacterized membrane protein